MHTIIQPPIVKINPQPLVSPDVIALLEIALCLEEVFAAHVKNLANVEKESDQIKAYQLMNKESRLAQYQIRTILNDNSARRLRMQIMFQDFYYKANQGLSAVGIVELLLYISKRKISTYEHLCSDASLKHLDICRKNLTRSKQELSSLKRFKGLLNLREEADKPECVLRQSLSLLGFFIYH